MKFFLFIFFICICVLTRGQEKVVVDDSLLLNKKP